MLAIWMRCEINTITGLGDACGAPAELLGWIIHARMSSYLCCTTGCGSMLEVTTLLS